MNIEHNKISCTDRIPIIIGDKEHDAIDVVRMRTQAYNPNNVSSSFFDPLSSNPQVSEVEPNEIDPPAMITSPVGTRMGLEQGNCQANGHGTKASSPSPISHPSPNIGSDNNPNPVCNTGSTGNTQATTRIVTNTMTPSWTREPRDVVLAFRVSRTLADRIEAYNATIRKSSNKTQAVTALIETGLFVVENASKLDDPLLVKYFQDNLYNVQLVDDIMEWPQDRIEALIGVLVSERDRRIGLKIGKR